MGNKKLTLRTIKNRDEIHPYSRKAHQLSRVYQRREKMAKKEKQKSVNPIGDRWLWFRYAMDEDKTVITRPEIHDLIEIYLARNDEELEELENSRNKGHRTPKTPRQDLLEALKLREANEYISGLELPDLTNGKVVKLLREWDGDRNSMSRMSTIRLAKSV
ncbi:translation machinery-associated protein 16 [Sporodiniella umbellata]|nr:translation machinery-associated protein 16 [Sporodiniella umbellata]